MINEKSKRFKGRERERERHRHTERERYEIQKRDSAVDGAEGINR